MMKRLAVGNSSFTRIMRQDCYYVDKTSFIKPLMESASLVELITRPRRFGKTLFIDTLRVFLSINSKSPEERVLQKDLFQNLAIFKDKYFCDHFMGKIPTIFLSFKRAEGPNFSFAYGKLTTLLSACAADHAYLLESSKLNKFEKRNLRTYMKLDPSATSENMLKASNFLNDILFYIAKHFERPAVLLIDEYDVPLAKAASGGYYEDMCSFMRSLLGVLKPEDTPLVNGLPILEKAVLTGCLRVSKESIFTGVNNFSVNTVCTDNKTYAACMGFTEPEVSELLRYYGLDSRMDDVKRWYDGYRLSSQEIFCPWDVLNFCQYACNSENSQEYVPENYWSGTSGNTVIDEFLSFLSEEDADRMQTLLDGGEVELRINQQLTYADFQYHKSDDFWTLLLFTGYLTVSKVLGNNAFLLRIPNEEIRQTFKERVQLRFSPKNNDFTRHGVKFAQAAASCDADGMAEVLEPLLRSYVSVRDTASRAPAENYYHGFLSALLACAGNLIQDFHSNIEAGDGYADIVFSSGAGSRRIGVVIEVKRTARIEDLRRAAAQALLQINDKRYASCLDAMRCSRCFAYGIAFCGKHCEITHGKLKI